MTSSKNRFGYFDIIIMKWLPVVTAIFAICATTARCQVNFAGAFLPASSVTYPATAQNNLITATAVDPEGNIYLCNALTGELVESLNLGPGGFAPFSFSTAAISNPGVCAGPQRPPVLAFDGAGNIYSANATQIQMARKTSTGFGSLAVVGSGFNTPTSIAIDANGNLFVADSGSQQVIEVPKLSSGYGSNVSIVKGLSQLTGMAVDGAGNLYAAGGSANGSGYVVRAARTSTGFNTPVQLASGLDAVSGLAVDTAGNVFVPVSANAFGVYPSEITIWEIGITANGYAPIMPLYNSGDNAIGVSSDAKGNVYLHFVQDEGGNDVDQVLVGAPNSQPSGSIPVNGNPRHFGSVLNSFVTSLLTEPPGMTLSNRGKPSADFDYQNNNQVSCNGATPFVSSEYPIPCLIVVDFDPRYSGDREAGVLITDNLGSPITTAYLTGFAVGPQTAFDPGVKSVVTSGLGPVKGTVVDESGNVYIAESTASPGSANGVVKVTPATIGYGAGVSIASISNPVGIAMDGLGSLFVIDGGSGNVLKLQWTSTGFAAPQVVVDGSLLTGPTGIAVDALGNLYLTESSTHRVLMVPWLRTAFGIPTELVTSVAVPDGIAVDGAQNLYILDQQNNRVVELPWTDNHYSSQTTVVSGLSGPTAIAIDPDRNLYIVNGNGTHIVQASWTGTAYSSLFTIYSGAAGTLDDVFVDQTDTLYIGVNTTSGAGGGAVIKLDRTAPALLNFENTPVGQTSADSPKSVSVQNVGNQPLSITSLLYPLDFSMGIGDSKACTSTTMLAQGARCDLSVQYVPTVPGPTTESVIFTDNAATLGGGSHTLIVSSSGQSQTPSIYPASGFYPTAQLLTIIPPVAGAKIYYTQDGSMPTTSSTLYTAPVSISTPQSVNAIAVVNGVAGPVVNAVYDIQLAVTEVNFTSGIDGTQFALNHGATVTTGVLQLTDGSANEARSAWYKALVPISTFTTDFSFQLQSAAADGFTFTIQNAGLDAVGAIGGGLGYQNIHSSVAIKFDLANNQGEGNSSTGVYFDGAAPTVPALPIPFTVNLHSGDIMHAHLTYNGATLIVFLSDTVTGASFQTTYPGTIDIPSIVGGNYAWVGFTGSTGRQTAVQNILSWTYGTGGIAEFRAQAPIISPLSSFRTAPLSVSLQTTTPGGVMYYTLDGTTATTASTLYTVPFIANPEQIINAITAAPGYANSLESTAIYSDHTHNGFPGGVGSLSLNGSASTSAGALVELTNGGAAERSSAWAAIELPIQSFTTDFTFQLLNAQADGFTLTFQNTGPHAVGASGAGLGYGGMAKSVAVKFDLYNDEGEGTDSTGVFTGGATPTVPAVDLSAAGIDLHSGHLMHASVEYDGTALALTLTDTVTQQTATKTFPVNIPAAVGGSEAWVGFTAGTGTLSAVQKILSWTYTY